MHHKNQAWTQLLRRSLNPSTDLNFAKDDANRFLPYIIAFIVGLTSVFLCISLAISSSIGARKTSASQTISIHIPSEVKSENLTTSVSSELKKFSFVASFEKVADNDLKKQLKPWMGELEEGDSWPLPAVFRVKLRDGEKNGFGILKTTLEKLNPEIKIDGNAVWATQYSRIASVIQLSLYVLSLMLLSTLAAITIFASQTAMKLHANAIVLLHGIGASDEYIARQFAGNSLALTLKGALIGSVVAAIFLTSAYAFVYTKDSAVFPEVKFGVLQAIVFLLLPAATGAIGIFSARFATLRHLRSLP